MHSRNISVHPFQPRGFSQLLTSPFFPSLSVSPGIPSALLEELGGIAGGLGRSGWEVTADDENITAVTALPGFKPADVSVTVFEGYVEVRASRDSSEAEGSPEGEGGGVWSQSATRTLSIPQGTQKDNVRATVRDGLLTLVIPIANSEDNEGYKVEVGS